MSEYLPPVVTKLTGDLGGLARAFAEAEAMVEQYGRNVEQRLGASGRSAGHGLGEQLGEGLKEETSKPEAVDRPLDGLMKRVNAKFQELGKQSGRSFSDSLMAETKQVQTRLGELADEMTRTGNFDLMQEFRSQQGDLKILSRVKVEFDGVRREAERLKADLSSNKRGGLLDFALDEWIMNSARKGMNALGSLPAPQGLMQWLIVGAVAAAPMIGAAINAGILAGLGAGGIALGIIGAIQDPRVKATWADFGEFMKTGLAQAGRGFVDPMIAGAIRTRAVFSQIFTSLQGGLDRLAPSFGRLLDGALGLIQRMMPGFLAGLAAAGPFLDQVAADLPLLGEYLGVFFEEMAAGSPGAIQFFHDLVVGSGNVLIAIGGITEKLSQLYDKMRNSPLKLVSMGWLDLVDGASKTQTQFTMLNQVAPEVTANIAAIATSAGVAALKTQDWATAIDKAVQAELGAKNAHLGFNQAMLDFKKNVQDNGVALDDHTTKGIANEQMLLRLAQAAEADRQSVQKQTGDVGAATRVFDEHMQQIYDTAAALGFDKEKVDALIGSVRTIPHRSQTDIALEGVTKAEDDLREYKRSLLTVPTRIDTYFVQHFTSIGTPYAPAHGAQASANRYGGVVRHAAAGMINRPGIYEGVGDGAVVMAERETKKEGFLPQRGITHPEARGLLSEMASWYDLQVTSGPGSAGSQAGGGGYSGVGGVGGNQPIVVPIYIDGQLFYQKVIVPAAQRFKEQNGTTGVT